mmetsp:Transcript_61314/g.154760  ORF Transcript_61314/g.154760 Transcript_61314/m.154760 type:complete len:238 (+) Transcript_61314:463-1176(+)
MLGLVLRSQHALAAHPVQAQDAAHHMHQGPDLLHALALRQPLDDNAFLDGHQTSLRAAIVARAVLGRDLLDEVELGRVHRLVLHALLPLDEPCGAAACDFDVTCELLEVIAEEASKHAEHDDTCEVAVLRLPVPTVELCIVKPKWQRRVPSIPRQRVEEFRVLRQFVNELALHRDGLPQLGRLVQHLVAHAFELEPREVPYRSHLGLLQVLGDRCELPDIEACCKHPVLIMLGQCQL